MAFDTTVLTETQIAAEQLIQALRGFLNKDNYESFGFDDFQVDEYVKLGDLLKELRAGEEGYLFQALDFLKEFMKKDPQWAPMVIKACELNPQNISCTYLAWSDALKITDGREAQLAKLKEAINFVDKGYTSELDSRIAEVCFESGDLGEAGNHAARSLRTEGIEETTAGEFNLNAYAGEHLKTAAHILKCSNRAIAMAQNLLVNTAPEKTLA